ncbi:MAG: hypothetical protein ABSA16_13355 [Thermoguttaceae bacterium]
MASLLNITRSDTCRFGAALGAMLVVILLYDKARPDDGPVFEVCDDVQARAERSWCGWPDSADRFWSDPPGPLALTVDWRVLSMCDSHTSYQFGTPPGYYRGNYAPLSKLDWSLDSTWTGFRLGAEEENSAGHFQWLTPMAQGVNGGMYDYDWNINDDLPNDPTRLDSLSRSSERWNEGQMLELEYEFRLLKHPLGLPVDLWPLAGYRWQRFDMMSSDSYQIIPPDGPFQSLGTFKQDYSIGYLGTQLRGRLETRILPTIAWTLQGDWGYTQANNVDHHISGYEELGYHRYTMEDTHGDCLHIALTAEALFCLDRFSIGVQADHTEINTTGSHHWLVYNDIITLRDETWTNGVSVSSSQTSITAFLRLRF